MKKPTTSPRRRFVLAFPIDLDAAIRNQGLRVHAAIRSAILDGRLEAGLKLPSTRSLSAQLKVRRDAVVAAYEHLASDGLVEARQGAGTYVARDLPAPPPLAHLPNLPVAPAERRAFELGHTHVDAALLNQLGRHLRRRLARATTRELGYGDPRGSEHLRRQIAHYLAANRGVRCDPGCILIVSGTQHAIRLCIDALLKPGDTVWTEDPGYWTTRATLRASGLDLVAVPVDEEGLDVEAGLRLKPAASAVYVTPSHQFPTGVTMSMRRRTALIDWARSTQGWIFEDDYDSEFRYAGPPLTALAGLGGERVIYIGTFTKTMFASLRLGYLVAPPAIVERLVAARAALDRFSPGFTQDAVADLMAEGVFAAHIRRMRGRYLEARDIVVSTLRAAAGHSLTVADPGQGLHLVATLPDGVSSEAAAQILIAADVEAKRLSETTLSAGGREGFILGFSGHGLDELRSAADRLGRAAREIVGRLPHE